jgi:hypothetical protein
MHMQTNAHTNGGHRFASTRNSWSRDRIEYRVLVALSFFICLAVALAGRIAGSEGGEHGQSIFAQAKANAHAAIGYAFHG